MKDLFSISKADKRPLLIIMGLFVITNLIWAFYSNNTWDDDCPGRYQNTLQAFEDPKHFVSLWNRPLFVLLFAIPVQLGAWTIPVVQTFFSILAGLGLYKFAKFHKLQFAYLAFALLVFQPFVFGVSKHAMTEPLAITIIGLSLYLQTRGKWALFALVGGLLPLARLELVILFPFYALPLLNHKKWKEILYLGVPVLAWAVAAGIIHDNMMWLYDNTFGKESEENRYGHSDWDTYLSRYAYVVGPVLLFFSFIGIPKIIKNKPLRTYILAPFLLGFFVYTWFSWKGNMGNAAGFLRNIIPISPHFAILALAGISSWYTVASKKSISIKSITAPKKVSNWLQKAKIYNRKVSNGKFYGFLALAATTFLIFIYYNKKLEIHHKLKDDINDYSLFYGATALLIISTAIIFIKRKTAKTFFPSAIVIILCSYTLITEHPMANSSPERELISGVAQLYNTSYLQNRPTYANHPWFFWSGGIDRHAENMNYVKKDSLKTAPVGAIAIFENHYSHRLLGDVKYNDLANDPSWVELSQRFSTDRKKRLSIFEKVANQKDQITAQNKYILETDSLDPSSFYCIGLNYMNQQKNLEEAYNAFAKAVNIDSTYAPGFLGLGLVMIKKGNLKSAIDFYNKGIAADETSPYAYNLLINKGTSQINIKQFNAAVKTLKLASEKNAQNFQAHYYLGLAYQNLNKADESLKAYEQALKLNPKLAQAWENVAIIQFKTNSKKAACQNIQKAVKLGSKRAESLQKQICK